MTTSLIKELAACARAGLSVAIHPESYDRIKKSFYVAIEIAARNGESLHHEAIPAVHLRSDEYIAILIRDAREGIENQRKDQKYSPMQATLT